MAGIADESEYLLLFEPWRESDGKTFDNKKVSKVRTGVKATFFQLRNA